MITAVIDVISRLLAHRRLPAFYRQVLGGFIATGATTAFIGIGVLPAGTEAALVVAAGITVLLSGFAVVSTVQDAIGGYAVTAAGRAAEIAVASAGLLSGVVLGLKLAQRAGVQLDVAAELPADGTQITTALLASAAAAAFYAVGGYAAPQALLFAALAGIVPLLPGLTAYRGFYQLAVEGVADGLVTVTLALAIGLALAAGVALGQYLVRPNAIPLSSLPPPPPAERG